MSPDGVCVSSRGHRPRMLPQDGDLPLLGNLCFCTRCFPSHQLRNSVEFLKQMLTDPRALQGHSCCQGVPCSEAVPCSPTASGSCTGHPGAEQGVFSWASRGGCCGDSCAPRHPLQSGAHSCCGSTILCSSLLSEKEHPELSRTVAPHLLSACLLWAQLPVCVISCPPLGC